MAGRPTDCNPETTDIICQYLRQGTSIQAACGMEGIAKTTYYNWLKRGNAELARYKSALAEWEEALKKRKKGKKPKEPAIDESEKVFVDFVNAVTRARAHAGTTMALAVNKSVLANKHTKKKVRKFSQTRTALDKDGKVVPYLYEEITEEEEIFEHPPDGRLAIEWLKRHERDEWGDNLSITGDAEKPIGITRIEVLLPVEADE